MYTIQQITSDTKDGSRSDQETTEVTERMNRVKDNITVTSMSSVMGDYNCKFIEAKEFGDRRRHVAASCRRISPVWKRKSPTES